MSVKVKVSEETEGHRGTIQKFTVSSLWSGEGVLLTFTQVVILGKVLTTCADFARRLYEQGSSNTCATTMKRCFCMVVVK